MLIPADDLPVHQTAQPLAYAGGGHPDFYDRSRPDERRTTVR